MIKFHLHDWSKWSDPFDTAHDYSKLQHRRCAVCNKVQVKKIRQPWNQWFPAAVLADKKGDAT